MSTFNVSRVAVGINGDGAVEFVPVRQDDTRGKALGWLDRGKREIVIERNQPETGKHLVLLHEMCHAAAEDLKAEGVIKRQPSEEFIKYFSARLFGMLSCSGLWSGVTPEESSEFYAEAADES